MANLDVVAGKPILIGPDSGGIQQHHIFEQADIDAIEAALAARRPLLVRGEPGVGKSQLARAAAMALKWGFCRKVVDSRTEARDLKWTEDLVARLADAQTLGAARDGDSLQDRLSLSNYVEPGPLWWAFDWNSAASLVRASAPDQNAGCDPSRGMVVLIDEIDKADSELPNGLLDALGERSFRAPEKETPIRATRWPLIIATSNDERSLPDAFIRRCVVHHMALPSDADSLQAHLIARGAAHFPKAGEELLSAAAIMTIADRGDCQKKRLRPLPGQAEYLDLLRAVISEEAAAGVGPEERLKRLAPYFLKKHPEMW